MPQNQGRRLQRGLLARVEGGSHRRRILQDNSALVDIVQWCSTQFVAYAQRTALLPQASFPQSLVGDAWRNTLASASTLSQRPPTLQGGKGKDAGIGSVDSALRTRLAGNQWRKGLPAETLVIMMFEKIREDLKMHEGKWSSQGLWVMLPYRFGCWRYTVRPTFLRKPLSMAYWIMKTVSQILTGIDLPCEVKLGSRFRIEHFGGIIISGDAVIGDDVVIRNGVTIGLKRRDDPGSPVIGNRVDIGAGAKVLGKIRIGDDVMIGANAVVITDVPANSIAVGIPARIIPRKRSVSNQESRLPSVVLNPHNSETVELDMALLNS